MQNPSYLPSSSLPISGLTYIANFVANDLADEIITIIEQSPWISLQKRRVQNYGYVFDYKTGLTDVTKSLGPFPKPLLQLAQKLQQAGWFQQVPDQIIVNEYQPGQGIPFHIDSPSSCGDTVASLSLLSGVQMDFRNRDSKQIQSLYLEPRSLLLLHGEARYEWEHGIMNRFSDEVESTQITRSRRISLNFRTISHS